MSEMAGRLDRLEMKLDKLADVLGQQAILHERNALNLEEHMRRTLAAEARMGVIEEKHSAFESKAQKQMDTALLPIKAVKWLAAFLVKAAAVVGAVAVIGGAVKALMP